MDRIRLNVTFEGTFPTCRTEVASACAYVDVTLDDHYLCLPARITLATNEPAALQPALTISDRGRVPLRRSAASAAAVDAQTDKYDQEPRVYHFSTRTDIAFEPVLVTDSVFARHASRAAAAIAKDGPGGETHKDAGRSGDGAKDAWTGAVHEALAQQRDSKPPAPLLPADSMLLVYVYGIVRDDMSLPCSMQVGVGRVALRDVYRLAHGSGDPDPRGIDVRAYDIEGAHIGTLTVRVPDGPRGFVLSRGARWIDTRAPDASPATPWGTPPLRGRRGGGWGGDPDAAASERFAWRLRQWFAQTMRCEWPLSERVNCYHFFGTAGRYVPAAFFLYKPPLSNALFWLHLYAQTMRRHLVRTQQLEPERAAALDWDGVCAAYARLGVRERCDTLAQMLCAQVTSMRYMVDHVNTLRRDGSMRRVFTEDFNPPWGADSADCEDFGLGIMQLYDSFVACDLSSEPVLHELQLLARSYVPLECLDIVSSRSATDTAGAGGVAPSQITAHMNVMLLPTVHFVRGAALHRLSTSQLNNGGALRDAFARAMAAEYADARALERQLRDSMAARGGRPSAAAAAESEFDAARDLPVLMLEGTGIFTPTDAANPNQDAYAHVAERTPVMSYARQMIYHPPGDPVQFMLYVMMGFTNRLLVRHGVPCDAFYFTYLPPVVAQRRERGDAGMSIRVATGRSVYGVRYRDALAMGAQRGAEVALLAAPFMGAAELESAHRIAKRKRPAPVFIIPERHAERVRGPGDAIAADAADPASPVRQLFAPSVAHYDASGSAADGRARIDTARAKLLQDVARRMAEMKRTFDASRAPRTSTGAPAARAHPHHQHLQQQQQQQRVSEPRASLPLARPADGPALDRLRAPPNPYGTLGIGAGIGWRPPSPAPHGRPLAARRPSVSPSRTGSRGGETDDGTPAGGSVSYTWHIIPVRVAGYPRFAQGLLKSLRDKPRIVSLDYHIEPLSDDMVNVVLCFGVTKKKGAAAPPH